MNKYSKKKKKKNRKNGCSVYLIPFVRWFRMLVRKLLDRLYSFNLGSISISQSTNSYLITKIETWKKCIMDLIITKILSKNIWIFKFKFWRALKFRGSRDQNSTNRILEHSFSDNWNHLNKKRWNYSWRTKVYLYYILWKQTSLCWFNFYYKLYIHCNFWILLSTWGKRILIKEYF